jgi:hypothetical protein
MLRAQIGQSVVFKTPTKLQHPYCNSFEAIAIGKLDLVLDRRNVSLFRDLATKPIYTPRIRILSRPLLSALGLKKNRSTNVMVVGMLCSGIGLFGFQLRSENSKVACSKSAVLLETCDFEKLQFLEG